jgi:hypothetical protein
LGETVDMVQDPLQDDVSAIISQRVNGILSREGGRDNKC